MNNTYTTDEADQKLEQEGFLALWEAQVDEEIRQYLLAHKDDQFSIDSHTGKALF